MTDGMKFFIPAAKDAAEAESVYKSIKVFVGKQCPGDLTDRRIYALEHVHNGVRYVARVGEPFERLGEIVIAILEGYLYYVCTENRGVVRDMPYLVGREEVRSIVDFETENIKAGG